MHADAPWKSGPFWAALEVPKARAFSPEVTLVTTMEVRLSTEIKVLSGRFRNSPTQQGLSYKSETCFPESLRRSLLWGVFVFSFPCSFSAAWR